MGGPQLLPAACGGEASPSPRVCCPTCHDPLHPLVQLHTAADAAAAAAAASQTAAPKRTLQVLAWNHASCIRGLFPAVQDDDDDAAAAAIATCLAGNLDGGDVRLGYASSGSSGNKNCSDSVSSPPPFSC